MGYVRVVIDVDPEFSDSAHEMGVTDPGYIAMSNAIASVGDIVDGPTRCDENGVTL